MISDAPKSTAGKANIKICVDCFRNMYQSELKPLSNINGGKKIIRMPLGFILAIVVSDYPKIPMSLEK